MKVFVLILLLQFNVYSIFKEKCYENISCEDFNLLIETEDVLIIDVRSSIEYKQERIDGANLAANKKTMKQLLSDYEESTQILVYCTTGYRSKNAAKYICGKLGFKSVFNLEEGIVKWKKKDFPLSTEKLN